MAQGTACTDVPLPNYEQLTIEQTRGLACVACGARLGAGSVYRGVVLGREGGMLLDADVRSCPAPGVGR
ncbi:hypothetical protein [Streptomyces sp. NBC_00354]|uniref:hypothetical protein n=1 Tax=Streptomyces sp. NBC_00354 TaxID=2975723 RepID=UPI002E25C6C6